MNSVEEEVVLLKATTESIDSMVNFELFDVLGSDPDTNIMFRQAVHQRLFNIALTDFLSRTDKKAGLKQTSYLGALRTISANPSFDVGGSVNALRDATDAFSSWLEQEVEADTWMPSINHQVTLKLTRVLFLKMCGDLSKHNFLRAVGVAEDLQAVLNRSGVMVSLEEALAAFPDFYQRFHDDILNYHASTIAEFLNSIRWGIHEYLLPEYRCSIVYDGTEPGKYQYTIPPAITSSFARGCYWDLMNGVRRRPYVRKFTVTKWLKLRY
jgi:hypothetical protein